MYSDIKILVPGSGHREGHFYLQGWSSRVCLKKYAGALNTRATVLLRMLRGSRVSKAHPKEMVQPTMLDSACSQTSSVTWDPMPIVGLRSSGGSED